MFPHQGSWRARQEYVLLEGKLLNKYVFLKITHFVLTIQNPIALRNPQTG